MNFKTTIFLVVILALAGVYLLINRDLGEKPAPLPAEGTLLGIESKDLAKVAITPSSGSKFVLEKSASEWKLSEPIVSAVETAEVDSLLKSLTELKSRSSTDNLTSAGVDKPAYTVEVSTSSGNTSKLLVGEKLAVGDGLYVMLEGRKQAEVVGADLLERLAKKANDYRKTQLVNLNSEQIKQIVINRPEGRLSLQRQGSDWKVIEPAPMPADSSVAQDIVFAITGLRAGEFISDNPADAARYQLDTSARTTVFVSSDAPTTQPTATQPSGVTLAIGLPDVMNKNTFATVRGSNAIVKIPVSSISAFSKKPFELRDKKVLDIDPEQISRVTLAINKVATTQPTTRPASSSTVLIERRKQSLTAGPVGPSTLPAATQATTAPIELSKWTVASDGQKDANDATVSALLGDLHPLKADKYLESVPMILQSIGTYVLSIRTEAPGGASVVDHQITLTDFGDAKALTGSYNDLLFEVPRTILSKIEASFVK